MTKRDTAELKQQIISLKNGGMTFRNMADKLQVPIGTIKTHYRLEVGRIAEKKLRLKESPYPVFNDPLRMEGDAVIFPDLEIPFHHADFVNRVLDICDVWGIKKAILAGDVVHFNTMSGWNPSWEAESNGGIDPEVMDELADLIRALPKSKPKETLADRVAEIGEKVESDGFQAEMKHARKTVKVFQELFDEIHHPLGNHEGRYLSKMENPLVSSEVKTILEISSDKWKIAPYYFSFLKSGGIEFRVEHPKGTAMNAAYKLASKWQMNIMMGHSHFISQLWDISGNFYAWQIGHCVDESLLSYAAQRSTTRDKHKLGAVIVREGYPYLFHEKVDWKRMEMMA
jgi:hypothetical protein